MCPDEAGLPTKVTHHLFPDALQWPQALLSEGCFPKLSSETLGVLPRLSSKGVPKERKSMLATHIACKWARPLLGMSCPLFLAISRLLRGECGGASVGE